MLVLVLVFRKKKAGKGRMKEYDFILQPFLLGQCLLWSQTEQDKVVTTTVQIEGGNENKADFTCNSTSFCVELFISFLFLLQLMK